MEINTIYNESTLCFVNKTPRSKESYEIAKRFMPGGDTRTIAFFKPYPLTIKRAEGAYLFDVDGNRYIDLLNNYTSMIHGHAHPFIMEKVQSILSFGTAYAAVIPEQLELAKILCERIPSVEKVRFCNSGTEATMFAIRAARAFTRKTSIIKMEGGYHGTHDLVEYSVKPPFSNHSNQERWKPIPDCAGLSSNVARDVYIAPFNDANAVEEILKKKQDEIAAILVEPVMGVGGVIPPKQDYLNQLRKLADQYQVLLIFDEVQTLRLNTGGAQKKFGVVPDLTAMAKIIGGGYPIGAFGGREDIMAEFNPYKTSFLPHGGTFNGNKISMTAGIAAMELLNDEAIQRLEYLSWNLETKMKAAIKMFQAPISITREGSMMNIHFTSKPPTNYAETLNQPKDLIKIIHIKLLNNGVFIAPRGMMNLSTVTSENDIEVTAKAFEKVLEEMSGLF
ncbi:aspartate aminotransferase family protein [Neobacillus drentensis]|uniref:aspartate aminotransferase family protein n=1 Tax=Neobacillus drentensis TaxID=220684 RepID=UPI0008267468|nr:aspartate aminotransferase family protein [Neobacillus drentensis]